MTMAELAKLAGVELPDRYQLPQGYNVYLAKNDRGVLRSRHGDSCVDWSHSQWGTFTRVMNDANTDFLEATMHLEFTRKALGMMFMAYVSRGEKTRLAHVEQAALEAMVELSEGVLEAMAKNHLAELVAETAGG